MAGPQAESRTEWPPFVPRKNPRWDEDWTALAAGGRHARLPATTVSTTALYRGGGALASLKGVNCKHLLLTGLRWCCRNFR